jgi:hypothetical protein
MPLHQYINDPVAHEIIHNGATFQVLRLRPFGISQLRLLHSYVGLYLFTLSVVCRAMQLF